MPAELARLAAAAPRLRTAPRGDGSVVLDLPGWRAPEAGNILMRSWLRRLGYDARPWGLGVNRGSVEADADLLARRLAARPDDPPVSLVGWSLGGTIAREVARQVPERVARVVIYGSPVIGGPTHTVGAGVLGAAETRRIAELAAALDDRDPVRVPVVSIFSRRDGVVDWRACLGPPLPGRHARRGPLDAPRPRLRPRRVDRGGPRARTGPGRRRRPARPRRAHGRVRTANAAAGRAAMTGPGAERRPVEFPAGDGTVLRGALFVPAEPNGSPVVMAHGFSGVAAQIEHYSAAFAADGFPTLVLDHRGFGPSDGSQRLEVDPYAQMSDWRDAFDFVQDQPAVAASSPAGVWGSSFAGGLAMALAATDRRVGCVVAQIPNVGGHDNAARLFSDAERAALDDLLARDRAGRRRGETPLTVPVMATEPGQLCALPPAVSSRYIQAVQRAYPSWRNKVTVRSVEHMCAFEPSGWIRKVSPTPLQMIVAREDACTYPEPQLALFNELSELRKLVIHPGGHFDTYTDYFEPTMTPALAWFRTHLHTVATAQGRGTGHDH